MTTLTSKRLTLTPDNLQKLKTATASRLGFKKREVTINKNARSSHSFKKEFSLRDKFDKYPHNKSKKPKLITKQKEEKKKAWFSKKKAEEKRKHKEEIFNKRYRYETINGLKVKFPRLKFQNPHYSIIKKIKEQQTELTPKQKKILYIYQNISPKLAERVKLWDSSRLDLVILYSNIAGAEAALKMFDVRKRRFYIDIPKRTIKIASINKEAIREVKQNTQFMEILYGITKAHSRVTFFPFFICAGDHAKFKKIRTKVHKGLMNYYKGERIIHNMIKATLIRRAEKREEKRIKKGEKKKRFIHKTEQSILRKTKSPIVLKKIYRP